MPERNMGKICAFLLLVLLYPAAAFASDAPIEARDVVAAIFPQPLAAEYTCGSALYAELDEKFLVRWRPKVRDATSPNAVLADMLLEYSRLARSFCDEIQRGFVGKEGVIADIYARQVSGPYNDLRFSFENVKAMHWLKRESELLRCSVVLLRMYAIVKGLAPDLLDKRDISTIHHLEFRQVMDITMEYAAVEQRLELMYLLRDKGFAPLIPKSFDLDWFRADESRSREEGVAVAYLTRGFNRNAITLTRTYIFYDENRTKLGVSAAMQKFRPLFAGQ